MQLTEEQQEISDALYAYLSKPICILNKDMRRAATIVVNGSAGTGKTSSVTHAINKYCEDGNEDYANILFIAPTHAAKGVIQSKTECDCMTIHKALALRGDYHEDKDGNVSKVFVVAEDKDAPLWKYKVIVLDEASMVDDEMEAQLIKSLLPQQHLIVMQDALNQLPPPAQSRDCIFSYKDIYPKQYFLYKPMRFNADSDIFKVSSVLVEHIAKSKAHVLNNEARVIKNAYTLDGYIERMAIHSNTHKGVRIHSDPIEFFESCVKDIKYAYETNDPHYAVSCCYTNSTAAAMNNKLRARLMPHTHHKAPYVQGDWITIRMNSENWYNGDKCVVLEATQMEYQPPAELMKYNMRFKYYMLHIRRLVDGQEGFINCIGKTDGEKRSYNNSMGLWADDIHKMPKNIKGGHWRMWYGMKEGFHIPDYSYCTTIHLQQGNTTQNMYVLEFDVTHNKDGKVYRDNTNQLRLLYVAYTRARENVHILNPNYNK